MTNINVLQSPPSEFLSKYVNFELRNGMCFSLLAKAKMTSPRLERDLLMACASLRRSPVAPVRLNRSLPAKSTKLSAPWIGSPASLTPSKQSRITMCDRELRSFIFVFATARAALACCINDSTSAAEKTSTSHKFVTRVFPSSSCLILYSIFAPGDDASKSRMSSL